MLIPWIVQDRSLVRSLSLVWVDKSGPTDEAEGLYVISSSIHLADNADDDSGDEV